MSTHVIAKPEVRNSGKTTGIVLLAAYVALYAATLYAMVRFGQFEAGDALAIFAILGVGSLCLPGC